MLFFYNIGVRLYYILAVFASPFNRKAKLWVKGRKGIIQQIPIYKKEDRVVWIHASSVGEFEQAKPLIRALKAKDARFKIHVTFFSPSGYAVCKKSDLADSVTYSPLDTAGNYKKFIRDLGPEVLFLTKYDFWYHMIHGCKKQGVPVISYSSIFRDGQAYFRSKSGFGAKILRMIDVFYVQNEKSQELLKSIGLSSERIGDTRFDQVEYVNTNRKELEVLESTKDKPLIVLGSAWEACIELWLPLLKRRDDLRFLIAPHEVEGGVIELLKKEMPEELSFFSEGDSFNKKIFVMDVYGYLSSLYYYATIAYVGGGFKKSGVHNTLEAAVYGKPIIIGPNFDKFQEVHDLKSEGGLRSVSTSAELEEILNQQLDEASSIGQISRAYAEKHLGATGRMLDHLEAGTVWKA